MIIGMRGHDFGRMDPRALAAAIRETGFEATQLAFTKAFPAPAEQYMTREALCDIRDAFAGLALPVMGCYVSASDRDPDTLAEAKARFKRALSASVTLGAGCVGTETTHFTFPESEREAAYARLLEMGMNLRPKDDFFPTVITDKALDESLVPDILSFSGGVAACMGQDLPPYAYGDLGVLLARAITKSPAIAAKEIVLAENGIRATVIGAGNYSLALSGTTIAAPPELLPVKNVPVIEVPLQTAADIPAVGNQIAAGLRTFDLTDSQPVAVAFAGYPAPSFSELMALAEQIARTLDGRSGLFVTVSQADIAKALGSCLRHLLPDGKFLCMDRIACGSGDYIDIGHPVAEATALPVIVKQLIFS